MLNRRKYLSLKNRVVLPSTVCRLLAEIDEELFALEFMEWIGEILDTGGRHLAVDRKALQAAMKKVRNFSVPVVINVMDTATALVEAQF